MKNPFIKLALAAALMAQTQAQQVIDAYRFGGKFIKQPKIKKAGKYKPHQGKQEIARRQKQLAAGIIRTN